jgi:hypothetical protein
MKKTMGVKKRIMDRPMMNPKRMGFIFWRGLRRVSMEG